MSDHKFEKKVGQKLDDLKLTPSAKSWENIERELRKGKRRPAPVFWLPLLLLGLGAIGYFVFNADNNKNNEGVIAKNENKTAYNNSDDKGLEVQQPEKAKEAENAENPEVTELKKSGSAVASRPVSRWRERPSGVVTYNSDKTASRLRVDHRQVTDDSPSPLASPGVLAPEGGSNPRTEQNSINNPAESDLNVDHKISSPEKGETDAEKVTEQKKEDKTEQKAEQSPAPKPEKKKTKKWAFGINASGGVSSLSEGKLSFSNSQIAIIPQNRRPAYSFASPAVVPPPSAPPSKIYPGLSFGLGVITKYELSKRFSLTAAVNYLQLNTISKVGYKLEQVNNLVTADDRPGAEVMYMPPAGEQTRDYDNKFHFIEVPINLHTRINKSEKLPLYWNAGVSVSKLIKSNSLYYDTDEQIYYSDDKLLKKMQTAVSTGFSVSVFNKTSRPLWIGPTVRYNISPALKKEISPSNKHFMGLGLDVKWFLK